MHYIRASDTNKYEKTCNSYFINFLHLRILCKYICNVLETHVFYYLILSKSETTYYYEFKVTNMRQV
jgi:hypothetical protein